MIPIPNMYTWDPCWARCKTSERQVCYCLAAEKGGDDWEKLPFWMKENQLQRYAYDPYTREWHRSTTLPSETGTRFCAGSVVARETTDYVFLSQNVYCKDGFHLDQEIVYFEHTPHGAYLKWRLKPDPRFFRSERKTADGCRVYGCRDPYYLNVGNKHFLYVCADGARWGAPAQIILAESDRLEGPYEWVSTVCRAPYTRSGVPALTELERISVLPDPAGDGYIMLAHAFANFVSDSFRWEIERSSGRKITDTIVYRLKAPTPHGPFELDYPFPFVIGSWDTGLYGMQFHLRPGYPKQAAGLGWRMATHTIDPECRYNVDLLANQIV